MTLPQELLDELTSIAHDIAAHEYEAYTGKPLDEACAHSIAGNAVQVMSEPIERFGRACVISALSGAARAIVREGSTLDLGVMQCRRKPE